LLPTVLVATAYAARDERFVHFLGNAFVERKLLVLLVKEQQFAGRTSHARAISSANGGVILLVAAPARSTSVVLGCDATQQMKQQAKKNTKGNRIDSNPR